jgi:hypothetical protein
MLTVVYLSILQHKLVFLLSHRTFTVSFSVGVVTIDKVKWCRHNLTAVGVSQQHFNIISYDKPLNSPTFAAPSHVAA